MAQIDIELSMATFFVCPHCSNESYCFSPDGGRSNTLRKSTKLTCSHCSKQSKPDDVLKKFKAKIQEEYDQRKDKIENIILRHLDPMCVGYVCKCNSTNFLHCKSESQDLDVKDLPPEIEDEHPPEEGKAHNITSIKLTLPKYSFCEECFQEYNLLPPPKG